MMRATWFLMLLVGVGLALTAISLPARAQTPVEYPDVTTIEPFSAQANFMSLPGYLRWATYRDQEVWLTYTEATRIVLAQGGPVSPQAQQMARAK